MFFFTPSKPDKMKKNLQLILVLALSGSNAQAQILIPDSLYGINSIHIVSTPFGETFTKFLVLPGGEIIYAGYDYNINQNDFHIDMTRISVCGEIDSTFGVNGTSRVTFSQRNTATGFTLQQDGKILSVGVQAPSNSGSQQIPYVARFLPNGNPDTTFAGTGSNSLRFDVTSSGAFNSVHVLPDGRITCIGGSSGNINGGMNAVGVMRFMSNGTLDLSFNGTGKRQFAFSGFTTQASRIYGYVLQNGTIIATGNCYDGSFNQHFFSVAFDSTGAVDTTYAVNGIFTDGLNLYTDFASTIQNDEKVIIASTRAVAADGIEVVRLTTAGQQDATFGTGGRVTVVVPGMVLTGIKVLQNGRIMVMGAISIGFAVGGGVMLNSNGSVDSTFGINGFMTFDLNNNTGTQSFNDVLELPGNRLLAGGSAGEFLSRRYSISSNVPHITYNHPLLSSTGNGNFQWYRDSILISGASSSTFDPSLAGSYTVEITDDLGCTYMSDPFVISSVGINENANSGIAVYPNPFNDQLIINSDFPDTEFNVKICDTKGQLVLNIDGLKGNKQIINTGYLQKGVYLLYLNSNNKQLIQKIVK
jgi:uncharacterized delta-60 repeat protein